MKFILDQDYRRIIRDRDLQTTIDDDPTLIYMTELSVMDEIRTYLATSRYDVDKILFDVPDWSDAVAYLSGSVVYWEPPAFDDASSYASSDTVTFASRTYMANQATTAGQSPETNPDMWDDQGFSINIWVSHQDLLAGSKPANNWKLTDPRHQLLVRHAIDMVVYHLLARTNPRTVPDVRFDRYSRAVEFLKNLASGKITEPGLPLLEDQSEAIDIVYMGSQTKQSHNI